MNTAARMESTGRRGQIHISEETANLLIASGKAEWITLRDNKILAKGKGEMQTYWLSLSDRSDGKPNSHDSQQAEMALEIEQGGLSSAAKLNSEKTTRLIQWNVDTLSRLLKQILAQRKLTGKTAGSAQSINEYSFHDTDRRVIDEVKEVITLPAYSASKHVNKEDYHNIELPQVVMDQLTGKIAIARIRTVLPN